MEHAPLLVIGIGKGEKAMADAAQKIVALVGKSAN